MLARAVGATDFRPSISGGGGGRAAAHSLRECGRATVRRRGQAAEPRGSGHTEGCTHVGAGGGRDRFSTVETRRRGWAGCRAQPARVRESEGATARADCRTSGIRLHGGLHACWRAWCLTVRHAQGQPHELSTTSHLSGPPQRRPGPARAPLLAAAHLRPSRHFCSQWSLLKCNRDRNQTIRNHAVYVCLSLSRKCGNPRQIPYISRAFRVRSAHTSPSSLKPATCHDVHIVR